MPSTVDLSRFVSEEVAQVLLWRDVKLSGAVLGAGVATYATYKMNEGMMAAFFAKILCILVISCFIYAHVAKWLRRPQMEVPFLHPTEESVAKDMAANIVVQVNKAKAFARRLYAGETPRETAILAFALFISWKILLAVSLPTLLFATFLGTMALPKAYESRQQEIDALLDKVTAEAKRLYKEAVAKIPSAKTKKPSAPADAAGPSTEDKKEQ